MSAPTGLVVGASVLLSSPALWMVHLGDLTPSDAIERWLICLVGCWLAITVVGALAFPDVRPERRPVERDQREADPTTTDALES